MQRKHSNTCPAHNASIETIKKIGQDYIKIKRHKLTQYDAMSIHDFNFYGISYLPQEKGTVYHINFRFASR